MCCVVVMVFKIGRWNAANNTSKRFLLLTNAPSKKCRLKPSLSTFVSLRWNVMYIEPDMKYFAMTYSTVISLT